MLIESRGINHSVVNMNTYTREGYTALVAGNVASLGYKDYVKKPEAYVGSIADLLLAQPSTAVMHLSELPNEYGYLSPVMMAVNYHMGHSEGQHQIVVQNPADENAGQYVLWIPPESKNKVFYRRGVLLGEIPHPFETFPTNPLKIRNYFFHVGEPDEALRSFKELGFEFKNELLIWRLIERNPEFERLESLSRQAGLQWDP